MAIYAKQEKSDPKSFALHPHPLSLNDDEFEKLLFAIACHMCRLHKRKEEFLAFLSETLDDVYRKAGVVL